MAKYLAHEASYVGSGMTAVYRPAGVIVVPDNEIPSRRWLPLDQPAVEALARIGIETRQVEEKAPEQPRSDEPSTMSEMLRVPKAAKQRPSDRT
jgi:hypothetical protein